MDYIGLFLTILIVHRDYIITRWGECIAKLVPYNHLEKYSDERIGRLIFQLDNFWELYTKFILALATSRLTMTGLAT